jgi:hypothetical protein
MSKLDWLCREPKYHAATAGDVFLEHWSAEADAADFERQWKLQRAFANALPEKRFLTLSYVGLARFPVPSGEAREVLNKSRLDLAPLSGGAAVVLPARGFVAATLRAILTGLMLIQKSKSPTEVFATLDEATHWLARHSRRLDEKTLATLARELLAAAVAR